MPDRTSALLDWYRATRREFGWRRTRDPWAILVVEVMSQQTQIGRVEPFWERWMERFPTPAACASAPTEDVLRLWNGLGYNSRALRLQAAAALVAENGWPEDPEGLIDLPGVGPYTAAAVACQSFGHQVPTIDTNHRRVISRWVGTPLDGRELEETAFGLLPVGLAEDWNQALMDLGAGPCAKDPDCAACPVEEWCADPTIYRPPPSQGRFAGSSREARGAVLRAVLDRRGTADDLAERIGLPRQRLDAALSALTAEGLIAEKGGVYGPPARRPAPA